MNNDRAGDQVFANIDEILAEKIISRSKENAGSGADRVYGESDPAVACGGRRPFGRGSKSIPVIRIVMAVAAALILAKLILTRGNGRRNG